MALHECTHDYWACDSAEGLICQPQVPLCTFFKSCWLLAECVENVSRSLGSFTHVRSFQSPPHSCVQLWSSVICFRRLSSLPRYNVISGGKENAADPDTDYSFLGGGQTNLVSKKCVLSLVPCRTYVCCRIAIDFCRCTLEWTWTWLALELLSSKQFTLARHCVCFELIMPPYFLSRFAVIGGGQANTAGGYGAFVGAGGINIASG